MTSNWTAMHVVSRVLRVWRRRPVLTLTVVGTMSLALALSVAMSAILETVARRALVFPNGAELVQLFDEAPDEGSSGSTLPIVGFAEWRQASRLYRQLAAYSSGDATVWVNGRARVLPVTSSSGNLLATLGIAPEAGRLPTIDDEGVVPCPAVATRGTAVTNFGSAEAALNQAVTVDGRPCQVVGVVADRYAFPGDRTGLYITIAPRAEVLRSPDGRVGISIAQVQVLGLPQQAGTTLQMQAEAHTYFRNQPRARSLQDSLTVTYQQTLRTLGLASLLVLAVALLNLSAVLAVTAVQRVREWAIKGVLGASRVDLLQEVLTDALVLVGSGSVGGVVLAMAMLDRVRALGPIELADVALRPELLAVWVMALVPVVLLNGLPAWVQASRLAITRTAHLGAAGVASAASVPARRLLPSIVTVQLSGAIALVAVCLLFMAAITAGLTRARGFDADDVVIIPTFRDVDTPVDVYVRDVQQLRDSLAGRDGAVASLALDLPVPHFDRSFSLRGEQQTRGAISYSPSGPVRVSPVGPEYLRAMRTPLVTGRDLRQDDGAAAPPVVVVSRRFADLRLGGPERAVGQSIDVGYVRGRRATVVGVAEDVRRSTWDDAELPMVYMPLAQRDLSEPTAARALERILLVSRGRDARALSAFLAAAPRSIGLGEPWTLRQARLQEMSSLLLYLTLAAVFGATTLLVVGFGVFAVTSKHVQRSQAEFGVRQVVGATPYRAVTPACLTFGRWWAMGVVVGILVGTALLLRVGLWQVDVASWSPAVLGASAALVTSVAAFGVAVPLIRIVRRQPAQLLREE